MSNPYESMERARAARDAKRAKQDDVLRAKAEAERAAAVVAKVKEDQRRALIDEKLRVANSISKKVVEMLTRIRDLESDKYQRQLLRVTEEAPKTNPYLSRDPYIFSVTLGVMESESYALNEYGFDHADRLFDSGRQIGIGYGWKISNFIQIETEFDNSLVLKHFTIKCKIAGVTTEDIVYGSNLELLTQRVLNKWGQIEKIRIEPKRKVLTETEKVIISEIKSGARCINCMQRKPTRAIERSVGVQVANWMRSFPDTTFDTSVIVDLKSNHMCQECIDRLQNSAMCRESVRRRKGGFFSDSFEAPCGEYTTHNIADIYTHSGPRQCSNARHHIRDDRDYGTDYSKVL